MVADLLAYEQLYMRVADRFESAGLAAVNRFGWREPAQYAITDRITWVPGDTSGNAGTMAPARNPGGRPRSIGTLLELFSVTINASDTTAPENEQAQYRAVRLLRDAWYAAVYAAAHGTFAVKSEQWLIDRKERRFGAALRLVVELQARVTDAAASDYVKLLDAQAELDVRLGNVSEQNVVTPPPTSSGGATGGSDVTTYTAGEAIAPLRIVRVTDDGLRVVVAQQPDPEALAPLGIAVTAAASGGSVDVRTSGVLSDASWSWQRGPVLLGSDGMLTQTQPPELRYIVVIGYAIDADTIVVRIAPPIRLAD